VYWDIFFGCGLARGEVIDLFTEGVDRAGGHECGSDPEYRDVREVIPVIAK